LNWLRNGRSAVPRTNTIEHMDWHSTFSHFALLSDGFHWISFDDAVTDMAETDRTLPSLYLEIPAGGSAQLYQRNLSKQD
jgi:hypothetical protein